MSKFGKIVLAAAVMIMVMVMAVVGGTAVFAQNSDGGDGATPSLPQDGERAEGIAPFGGQNDNFGQEGGPRGGHGGRGGHVDRGATAETLAEILGISVEELEAAHEAGTRLPELVEELGLDMEDVQAALQAARIAGIEEAAANGEMTQEEADQILERMALREVMAEIFNKEDMQATTAAALGISVEELEAAHEAGTRLPELAEELGLDIEDVHAELEAAKADALAGAVADGLITQEQADEIASHEGRPGGRRGGPQGGCNGQGGRRGGPSGQPQGGNFNQGFSNNSDA